MKEMDSFLYNHIRRICAFYADYLDNFTDWYEK